MRKRDPRSEHERRETLACADGMLAGLDAAPLPSLDELDPSWWDGYSSGFRLRYVYYGKPNGHAEKMDVRRKVEKIARKMRRLSPTYARE